MENFFCAELSRRVNESLIGTASTDHTYVLIECPQPWATQAEESKHLPNALKHLIQNAHATQTARILLIANEQTRLKRATQVFIFRKQTGLSQGYRKQVFRVHHLEQVAPLVSQCLTQDSGSAMEILDQAATDSRDFFVCTHGSHDRCCSRYGYPFYRQAGLILQQLGMAHHRVWQISHIGGHRFAPTLVDFPEGRYYGALDQMSFRAILQRRGDLDCLRQVYRGWGVLPRPAQILEQELILQQGWNWFQYQVSARILQTSLEQGLTQVELTSRQPSGETILYSADVIEDEAKTTYLPGSCGSEKVSRFVKYRIDNLSSISLPSLSSGAVQNVF